MGVHPIDHPVLISSHLINSDGTGERQVEGDAVVLCPQLVPETLSLVADSKDEAGNPM
jgi:hypothetical protein